MVVAATGSSAAAARTPSFATARTACRRAARRSAARRGRGRARSEATPHQGATSGVKWRIRMRRRTCAAPDTPSPRKALLAAALALCAATIAGCGLGPGKDEGDVQLTVTRDYGGAVMLQRTDSIHESDTVLRVLDRNADISTRFGGGFIQSI